MPDPIIIVPYDSAWPARFEELRLPIQEALGGLAVAIEHVGSTSVEGLPAKPIIDMDVVIESERDLPEVIRRMERIGYRHQGDLGITGREAFDQPPGLPVHHLYVCPRDNRELRRHLLFRDWLRSHPEDMQAYAALKQTEAIRFRDDRRAFTDAKGAFVEAILKRAAGVGDIC